MKKTDVFQYLILLAAVALVTLMPATAQVTPDPPTVGFVQARVVRIAPTTALPGTVVSRNDSQLASEVEGRIAWVAEVGTVVAANDVVARIDNNLATLQQLADKANVSRLAAQLRFDRSQAERMQNLFNQNAIARSTRDQAASSRDMDVAALAQAQATLKRSEYQLAHSDIRAPFSGRVVARLINPGEYAVAGKPVVRLVDISSLEVSVQAPIDATRFVHEAAPLTVEIEGKRVGATVRAIVPVGDVVSRTIEVRLTLPAGAGLVGDAAKVLIPSAEPHDALAVSRDALVLREDNTYIFKIDAQNRAQRIAVETGAESGPLVEIKGPISAGERVIVRGAERMETGRKVRAVRVS